MPKIKVEDVSAVLERALMGQHIQLEFVNNGAGMNAAIMLEHFFRTSLFQSIKARPNTCSITVARTPLMNAPAIKEVAAQLAPGLKEIKLLEFPETSLKLANSEGPWILSFQGGNHLSRAYFAAYAKEGYRCNLGSSIWREEGTCVDIVLTGFEDDILTFSQIVAETLNVELKL